MQTCQYLMIILKDGWNYLHKPSMICLQAQSPKRQNGVPVKWLNYSNPK